MVEGAGRRVVDGTDSGGPGRSYRKEITLAELFKLFPNGEAAREWFEATVWSRCRSGQAARPPHHTVWCVRCRRHFSVRVDTWWNDPGSGTRGGRQPCFWRRPAPRHIRHEAAPGSGHPATQRMVHAASHTGGRAHDGRRHAMSGPVEMRHASPSLCSKNHAEL